MENPLTEDITETAFAFRGYNITNLGRTAELLQIKAYRDLLLEELRRFGKEAAELLGVEETMNDELKADS